MNIFEGNVGFYFNEILFLKLIKKKEILIFYLK